MGRQTSGDAESPTANKLTYWWVPSQTAAKYAEQQHSIFEKLCKGYSFLDNRMFVYGLATEEFHVLMLPNYCAALVSWVTTSTGKTLNILTTAGDMEHADEALKAIIAAASDANAKMIFSVGRIGWQDVVEANGFTTKRCLAMTKVLP